jgi:Protein of unknown function (DUF3489)
MSTPAKPRTKAAKRSTRARPAAKRAKVPRKTAAKAQGSPGSKQSRLITALQSSTGATISQLTKLTGWQPHTVRGAISGALRKRLGLKVESIQQDEGPRIYRIVGTPFAS